MLNGMTANATVGQVRELTALALDQVAGGLDIGPIHIEAGQGLFSIDIGGYGIWGGRGCIGVSTPNRVVGVCGK